MAEDLALDLQELRQLESIAKRPRVVSLISSEISHLEKRKGIGVDRIITVRGEESSLNTACKAVLSKEQTSDPLSTSTPIQTPISSGVKLPSALPTNYVTLGSFSWDQDSDKVKIYVSLEGVEQEKIKSEFRATSFDVKFHDVQGKNYRCAIPKLNKEIVPEKCLVVVKPKRVIITLLKASKGNWLDIHFKEDKLKPNLDEKRDPMAGIMDLMKNMYDEGDEDMKKTIAKAWTDARSGNAADPLKGYR